MLPITSSVKMGSPDTETTNEITGAGCCSQVRLLRGLLTRSPHNLLTYLDNLLNYTCQVEVCLRLAPSIYSGNPRILPSN